MLFEESILISATAEKVFSLYSNVPGWPSWDPDVRESSIDGPFAPGARGTLRPSNGPKARITLTEVAQNRLFTVESRLPLCVMRFEHELSDASGQTRARHRVSFSGVMAPVFGRLIGSQIRNGLPRTLEGLKRAAEETD